jgi:hypothetical protein
VARLEIAAARAGDRQGAPADLPRIGGEIATRVAAALAKIDRVLGGEV